MEDSSGPRSLATADRRRPLVWGTLAVATLIGVAVILWSGRGSSSLEEARSMAREDANFATATDAGVTFTRISRRLQDEAEACREGASDDRDRAHCDALFTASAYARVSAVAVLRCTRPGVFDARASLQAYLEALAASDDADPTLPPTVRCR